MKPLLTPLTHATVISSLVAAYFHQGFLNMEDASSRAVVMGLPVIAALLLRAVRVALLGDGVPLPVKLVRTVDGDTLVVDHMGVQMKVRLYGVDAPEADQPYGKDAERYLFNLCAGAQLMIVPAGTGSYDRSVATLLADGVDVGLQLVSAGLAWPAQIEYLPPTGYLQAHAVARDGKCGLFIEKDAMHPSMWRKLKKDAAKPAA